MEMYHQEIVGISVRAILTIYSWNITGRHTQNVNEILMGRHGSVNEILEKKHSGNIHGINGLLIG
jgi:hypothetical protein